MKMQLKPGSLKLAPKLQMAVKAEPQKRKAAGAPVGFVTKKAKKEPAAQSFGGAAGNMDPMQMMGAAGNMDPMAMMQMVLQSGETSGDEKVQMMQMMMQMMPMMQQMGGGAGGVGGGGGGAAAAAAAAAPAKVGMDDNQWKCKLHELLSKNDVADKPEYSCEEIGEGAERCYQGRLAIQEHSFEAASTTVGKKEAQQLAAKAATEMLFPDDFKRLSQSNQGAPAAKGASSKGGVPKAKPELKGKQLLTHYMNLYLQKTCQRAVKKDDVKFEMEEGDAENNRKAYVSTVMLAEGLAGRTFQGELSSSKAEAEGSAAEEAVRQLSGIFMPIAAERNAIKAQKKKESLEKLKEEHGGKKKLKIKAL